MVKRCSHGTCKTDDRYPDRLSGGVQFVPFPKPKTEYDKCLRWIRLCGRPHDQLNPTKINANRYVCTKHFVNQSWPTRDFLDPLSADPYTPKDPRPARVPPSKRRKLLFENSTVQEKILHEIPVESTCNSTSIEDNENQKCSNAASQTCERWINPLDFIAVVAENNFLKMEMAKNSIENLDLQRKLKTSEEACNSLSKVKSTAFDIDNIIEDEKLIRYYSGFTKDSFNSLFTFLVPNQENPPLTYVGKGNLTEINSLSLKNQLFLTLSNLRNNFDLEDLGFRFGVTQQVAGVMFNSWVNYMFLRFGEVSIWPHRDVIMKICQKITRDFPNTFGILDCTEIKIQKPSSLKAQSQTYSDYKSSNTQKDWLQWTQGDQ